MTIDKNRLKALAEAATQGPWHHTGTWVSAERGNSVADCSRGDEEFIAAANPANILALLGEIERHEKNGDAMVYEAGMKAIAEQRDLLKAENEELRRNAGRFEFIERDADSGMSRIYGDDWVSVIDAAMAKEQSHDH